MEKNTLLREELYYAGRIFQLVGSKKNALACFQRAAEMDHKY